MRVTSSALRGLRPELQILILAGRGRLAAERATEVLNLLQATLDWGYLTQAAIDHGIANRLFVNLISIDPSGMPEDLYKAASDYLDSERQRYSTFVGELFTILDALNQHQIRAIPFKGPLLASLLYGDIAARSCSDLDFLVRPESVVPALQVLEELGYDIRSDRTTRQEAAFRRYAGQYVFFPQRGLAPIEPHWAFCPRTLAVDLDYDGIWQRVVSHELHGRLVRSFAPEDQLTILALQGTKDEWARLRLICDIADLIAAYPQLAWPAVIERMRSQGVLRMLRVALILVRDVLGDRLPAVAEAGLIGDRAAAKLAQRAARLLFDRSRAVSSVYAVSRMRLASRERYRDRALYLARTTATPRAIHYGIVRLPPPLFFLYCPIKLGYDYVALPIWLLKKSCARGWARLVRRS